MQIRVWIFNSKLSEVNYCPHCLFNNWWKMVLLSLAQRYSGSFWLAQVEDKDMDEVYCGGVGSKVFMAFHRLTWP